MYLGTILLSMLVAWLRRGSFAQLGRVTLRALWAIFLALLLQLSVHLVTRWQWDWPMAAKTALYLLSYVCLLYALWANRRLPGIPIVFLGVALNLLVICMNGGHMPVSEGALLDTGQQDFRDFLKTGRSPTHALIGEGTSLPFLGDILHFPWSPPLRTVFSPGDILLMLGLFVLVQGLMVPRRSGARAVPGGEPPGAAGSEGGGRGGRPGQRAGLPVLKVRRPGGRARRRP
ncbi:MAG: DUF5317 domain-containing protein [Acetobacteraceae bacterium]|nr:DUF5317 domain-containing protein [Acetobacteraceae bacterium]